MLDGTPRCHGRYEPWGWVAAAPGHVPLHHPIGLSATLAA